MVAIDKQAITDIWLTADWDEYIKNTEGRSPFFQT